MEAKEKAKELVDKFTLVGLQQRNEGIQCALIAVDEIVGLDIFNCNCEWSDEDGDTREYWREVKQEIEKK
jgi:hypothetical protein